MNITIYGLGEAGSLIGQDIASALHSNDLAASGNRSTPHPDRCPGKGSGGRVCKVTGFDPRPVPTPEHIQRVDDAAEAVQEADFVLSFTASVDAKQALQQGLSSMPADCVYADFASASAGLKAELATLAASRQIRFVDVALMAMVPGNGISTPAMCSGSGHPNLVELLQPLGMPITAVSDQAGDAAQRKLLRSVVIKGLAALLIESLEAAHQTDCADWLWQNLSDEFTRMDHTMLERLVTGTGVHAARRLHEMQASASQLQELGVEPLMTNSTVGSLQKVLEQGVPKVPGR